MDGQIGNERGTIHRTLWTVSHKIYSRGHVIVSAFGCTWLSPDISSNRVPSIILASCTAPSPPLQTKECECFCLSNMLPLIGSYVVQSMHCQLNCTWRCIETPIENSPKDLQLTTVGEQEYVTWCITCVVEAVELMTDCAWTGFVTLPYKSTLQVVGFKRLRCHWSRVKLSDNSLM